VWFSYRKFCVVVGPDGFIRVAVIAVVDDRVADPSLGAARRVTVH
jgi:hypothetical protein